MRVSALTSFVLATVVSSAAGKSTYLKTSDGDYWLGSYTTSDSGDAGELAFYPKFAPGQSLAFTINNDTTLNFGDFNFYLDLPFGGPDGPANLSSEIWAYELVRDGNGAKGFSWGQNGTLELSNSKFHGWVHCKGGEWTGSDGNSTFWWSTEPITKLPDGCGQVDLVKDLH